MAQPIRQPTSMKQSSKEDVSCSTILTIQPTVSHRAADDLRGSPLPLMTLQVSPKRSTKLSYVYPQSSKQREAVQKLTVRQEVQLAKNRELP